MRPREERLPEEKMPRGPNGRKLCRQCQTETKPPRRTFCSDACVDAWRLASDAAFLRHNVHERDKGICAVCRLDTDKLRRGLEALRDLEKYGYGDRGGRESIPDLFKVMKDVHRALGTLWSGRVDYWDADHIQEVVRGGGECGLSNMQTLCLWCHKVKTARLAKERAEERRLEAEKASGQQRLA